MLEVLAGLLIVIGAAFSLIAAIGLYRLPDLYTRMHAASKAGTLGSGVLLIALALASGDLGVVTRSLAGVLFFLLTAPVAAHLLARAAYFTGVEPWSGTRIDDLAGRYQDSEAHLASAPPRGRDGRGADPSPAESDSSLRKDTQA
jgi:multicomponent Na+:H+ antiporter subunit G